MKGGTKPRVSSPAPGFSILITSAPRSASICTQVGPARTRVKSNTLRPLSGPLASLIASPPAAGGSGPRGAGGRWRRREKRVDLRRAHDGAVAHEGLVVGLDRLGIIEVIHHDAAGLRDAAARDVAEPVDALEPGAVAEMEARHRVGWPGAAGRAGEIERAEPQQRPAQRLDQLRILPPILAPQQRQ